MAEANRAYEEGDEAKLRAILDEWVSGPDSVPGEGVAAELVRTIRKIHQVERRLADIEAETSELKRSELHKLKQNVAIAKDRDRDLLAEMAEQLKQQIAGARMHLAKLSSPEAAV
jgi:outer membrane lipopolysaccharide assembly protein LptE/RlpB